MNPCFFRDRFIFQDDRSWNIGFEEKTSPYLESGTNELTCKELSVLVIEMMQRRQHYKNKVAKLIEETFQ